MYEIAFKMANGDWFYLKSQSNDPEIVASMVIEYVRSFGLDTGDIEYVLVR